MPKKWDRINRGIGRFISYFLNHTNRPAKQLNYPSKPSLLWSDFSLLVPHQQNPFWERFQSTRLKTNTSKDPHLPNGSGWQLQSSPWQSCYWTVLSHPPSHPARPDAASSQAPTHKCWTLLNKGKKKQENSFIYIVSFQNEDKPSHLLSSTWRVHLPP